MSVTEEQRRAYQQRYLEAEEVAELRKDKHTRTMLVMLEKQVDAWYRRCQECWEQADEQKAVIGGLLTTVETLTKRIDVIDETRRAYEERQRAYEERKKAESAGKPE